MCNRVKPDFRRIAEVEIENHEEKLNNHTYIPGSEPLIQSLKRRFQELYEQGWSAGYMDGQEHGWVDTLESDVVYQRLNDGRESIPYDFEKED